jgi:hypothetical protein
LGNPGCGCRLLHEQFPETLDLCLCGFQPGNEGLVLHEYLLGLGFWGLHAFENGDFPKELLIVQLEGDVGTTQVVDLPLEGLVALGHVEHLVEF